MPTVLTSTSYNLRIAELSLLATLKTVSRFGHCLGNKTVNSSGAPVWLRCTNQSGYTNNHVVILKTTGDQDFNENTAECLKTDV